MTSADTSMVIWFNAIFQGVLCLVLNFYGDLLLMDFDGYLWILWAENDDYQASIYVMLMLSPILTHHLQCDRRRRRKYAKHDPPVMDVNPTINLPH